MNRKKFSLLLLSFFLIVFGFCGCAQRETPGDAMPNVSSETEKSSVEKVKDGGDGSSEDIPLRASFESVDVNISGRYTSLEEVASYIFLYDTLPANYITKSEARKLGWKPSDGNLWEVTDQMSIGGDVFGNREGKLPKQEGRIYYECDIDYEGGRRNAKRIVYSNDGLIFYTEDHYKSFERLECT